MYQEISKFVLFSDLQWNSILSHFAFIFEDWEQKRCPKQELVQRINWQVKCLLDLATEYGFDENLWQCYLTYLLMTNENSFSLTCERTGAGEGSVNQFAKADLAVFQRLFRFDFSPIEQDLQISCFSILTNYQAIAKKEQRYNKTASEKILSLTRQLRECADETEMFAALTEYYRTSGLGIFGFNRAFRIKAAEQELTFLPINNIDGITFRDLVGYERQKKQLIENTEAFLRGYDANNVLLYGDSGTGKSSSVKALLNEYYPQGLRMIEIYKYQFRSLSDVIAKIKNRNYRFIIFIDDLSFEENEVEYKFLKAVIEGGVETKPNNVLIYATSNRRHLIRETWNDRNDMEQDGDIHRSDTVEEKLSLAGRFGVQINYSLPNRSQFNAIVKSLADRAGIRMEEEALLAQATRWELRHGGISGRTAQQFINYLQGLQQ